MQCTYDLSVDVTMKIDRFTIEVALLMKAFFFCAWILPYFSVGEALVHSEKIESFTKSFMHFVDDSIVDILFRAPSDAATQFFVDNHISFPDSANIDDLVDLAHQCDRVLFEDTKNPSDEEFGLALSIFVGQHEGPSHASLIAALLAVNGLESAIRDVTGYSTGHAPLLKTMIRELPERRVYELLLTPAGLNLRNLLWHGFLAVLPRCWFSLVLTLTQVLAVSREKISSEPNVMSGSRRIPQVDTGSFFPPSDLFMESLSLSRNEGLSIWLPSSHYSLVQNHIQPWIDGRKYPATCCALLSILLEHGLRLSWCMANHRPLDRIAYPGKFYVTLDGHGQRRIHDLLLHPYLLDGSPNRLITDDTASIISLLTDLFCSSSGGQNIRASVSHGSWDEWLVEEWSRPEVTSQDHPLWRTVNILVFAMDSLATDTPITYQPQFSYTAVMRNSLRQCESNLKELIQFSECNHVYDEHLKAAQTLLGNLLTSTTPSGLLALQEELELLHVDDPLLRALPSQWNRDTLLAEYTLNEKLHGLSLVLSLLEDVAVATHQLVHDLDHALQEYPNLSSRKKKSALRFVYDSSRMGIHLYTIAYNLAVFSLNHVDKDNYDQELDLKRALERTSMTVSTTQTMLRLNVDRARQAIVEYSKSKAVRQAFHAIAARHLMKKG